MNEDQVTPEKKTLSPASMSPSTPHPDSTPPPTSYSTEPTHQNRVSPEREFEKSGLYPKDGKAFRLWALLGWLSLLIGAIAGASALLNFILL